jgi:hypothetical protein
VQKIILVCLGLCLLGWTAMADTFQLNDGKSVNGEPLWSTANETELTVRVGEGEYEKVPWTSFSQEDLKKFQSNPKLAGFVEPFIEVPQSERIQKTQVNIQEPPRLDKPPARSLFGAMFSTSLGALIMILLYAANFYAAYEVAIFRARPVPVVCGVSAVLPVVGPIIFLSMPTLMERVEHEDVSALPAAAAPGSAAAQSAAAAQSKASAIQDSDPLAPDPAQNPHPAAGGLHIAHAAPAEAASTEAAHPQTQTFQRGAFTFNRRFFETKFPGFFGVVRREADKDMVLVVKGARGEYTGTRISRITGNDFHLEVHKGGASEEVLIPFTEIKEIKLKHKDAQ